jgi:hypothetical protein
MVLSRRMVHHLVRCGPVGGARHWDLWRMTYCPDFELFNAQPWQ